MGSGVIALNPATWQDNRTAKPGAARRRTSTKDNIGRSGPLVLTKVKQVQIIRRVVHEKQTLWAKRQTKQRSRSLRAAA